MSLAITGFSGGSVGASGMQFLSNRAVEWAPAALAPAGSVDDLSDQGLSFGGAALFAHLAGLRSGRLSFLSGTCAASVARFPDAESNRNGRNLATEVAA